MTLCLDCADASARQPIRVKCWI
uniref:Uncharacterized protein n=1 Tax=Anguilla anguilla TaxID=7936 RepID=A0A0E9SYF1_ANGAN